MKSKWVIVMLALAFVFCQGVAFAETMEVTETVETVEATADDAVTDTVETVSIVEEEETAAPTDELYAPTSESVKVEAPATAEETMKM